ncbi:MAG: sulfatase [bacterium]
MVPFSYAGITLAPRSPGAPRHRCLLFQMASSSKDTPEVIPRGRLRAMSLGVLLLLSCAPHGGTVDVQPNLLLISIDTLRADRLSCYGYPRPTSATIDQLAAEGALFREVIVPRGQTWPSLTSLFTGEEPIVHGVRTNGQKLASSRRTLATDLRDSGYATAAFLTNMIEATHPGIDSLVICRMFGVPQWKWDEKAVRAGVSWLAERESQPWFAWIHLIDPHMPYAPASPLDTLYRRGLPPGPAATLSEFAELAIDSTAVPATLVNHFIGLYDGQVNGVDGHVAEILAAVDSLSLRERTLILVIADHGEDLFERNRYFGHSCSIYHPTLHVPLLISFPGVVQRGIVDVPMASTDIRATLLDLLGCASSEVVPGESRANWIRETGSSPRQSEGALGGVESPADSFQSLIEWAEEKPGGDRVIYGLRDSRWKYVSNPDDYRIDNDVFTGRDGHSYRVAIEELYDLAADPWELTNVVALHPERAARMKAALANRVAQGTALARGSAAASDSVDAATAEALRALGYVK